MLFFLVPRIALIRRYMKNPHPTYFRLVDLVHIWMYTTCIMECFKGVDPIISDIEWDKLTHHLLMRWPDFPEHFKYVIPRESLGYRSHVKINWDGGMGMLCRQDCADYAKLWKTKRLKKGMNLAV